MKHSTNSSSVFANVAISDETANAWAERYSANESDDFEYVGKHRPDTIPGVEFDYDQLLTVVAE